MKDEEMADKHAEEYVMRDDTITENDRVPFDNGYGFQTVSFEDEVKKGYKDGFLAGLKAGRPQWHDLRKDPTDLPKESKRYLCQIECCVGSAITHECSDYDIEYNSWKDSYGDVIKWCEISF